LPTDWEEAVLGLAVEQAVVGGAVTAGLSIVGTFCWAWRHRSVRKTLLALREDDRRARIEQECERRKTLQAVSKNPVARTHEARQQGRVARR
jgi:hypothetical protein